EASVPLTPAMVANNNLLSTVIAGTRISVPISGTLSSPKLDRGAFRVGMKELGSELLRRGAMIGASDLIMRLGQPRDPNAPRPPTLKERRALRREMREQQKQDRLR